MEIGIGIHGEPGRQRLRWAPPRSDRDLATAILQDPAYQRTARAWNCSASAWQSVELVDAPLKAGDFVLAFVNSMGGTPLAELYVVYRKLAEVCRLNRVKIVRSLVGPYITSLEMQGGRCREPAGALRVIAGSALARSLRVGWSCRL